MYGATAASRETRPAAPRAADWAGPRRVPGRIAAGGAISRQKWQATRVAVAVGDRAAASSSAQRGRACGQRVRKWQPDGGSLGLGTSPASRMRAALQRRLGHRDRRQQRLRVRMARRGEQRALVGVTRRCVPRYITAMRVAMNLTTARSCAMKMYDRPRRCCRSRNRLMTCAWIETSSAETGSSHTISRGSTASARAMPMRCRCPPENSCG